MSVGAGGKKSAAIFFVKASRQKRVNRCVVLVRRYLTTKGRPVARPPDCKNLKEKWLSASLIVKCKIYSYNNVLYVSKFILLLFCYI